MQKIIGFYPVVGDLLHAGHILALKEAKENCDYLIVGLNCLPDGKNPTQSIYERFIQLQAVKYVDEIVPYGGRKDLELLASSLDYQIRFLGEDYKNKDWDGKEIEESLCKTPYFLRRRHCLSSTELKERIRNG
jgi:glycerol-3-phosphate cytidylyltransferase